MQYGMVINTDRCIGCQTCAVACHIENNQPIGIWWNRVLTDGGNGLDIPKGTFPNTTVGYFPLACQHCADPACVKVCPVGATYKDEENGVVMQDYDKCIGCRMCIAACPYTDVRSFNWKEPEYDIDFALGSPDVSPHQKHTVEKCTFCVHRLAEDKKPACVVACPGYARTFGDLDDPESEVSQLIRDHKYQQLLPDKGTHPSIYYIS